MKFLTCLFLLSQSLLQVWCSNTVPTFTLNAERSWDGSPSITITFPDGYSDNLVLNKHFSNSEDELTRFAEKDDCNYLGKLAKEDVCVAMTGCPGQDDLEFTILSSHASGSGWYRWTKNGDVEVIESPFKNMTLALTRNDGDIIIDDDVLIDPKVSELEAKIEEECWNGTSWNCGEQSRTIVPTACNQRSHVLAYRVGYDTAFMNKAGGKAYAEWHIHQAFTHVQAYYCQASLGTKIQLQRYSIKHYNENWCAHDGTKCLQYACRHNPTDMQGVDDMVFFTHADNPTFNGVGWMSSICGGNHFIRNMCNLNIYQSSAVSLAGVSMNFLKEDNHSNSSKRLKII